jgi:hypothetical protein
MELPKKIYLFENPVSGYADDRWLTQRSCEDDIEYTRTDAFIEKACAWWENELTYPSMTSEEIKWYKDKIEDFRKAMKEE